MQPLTKDIKPDGQPLSIEEYEHCGGYLPSGRHSKL